MTERFIDQNLKLVNNHHNKVTLSWAMLLWIVCFKKCSLHACTPFSKWAEWKTSFQHNRVYQHQIRNKWRLDVPFAAKTQKLLFYFCVKWGRLHTKNSEMKTSHCKTRTRLPSWFYYVFCFGTMTDESNDIDLCLFLQSPANMGLLYGTQKGWWSAPEDDVVCHTTVWHSWCGRDQGLQHK